MLLHLMICCHGSKIYEFLFYAWLFITMCVYFWFLLVKLLDPSFWSYSHFLLIIRFAVIILNVRSCDVAG